MELDLPEVFAEGLSANLQEYLSEELPESRDIDTDISKKISGYLQEAENQAMEALRKAQAGCRQLDILEENSVNAEME